MTTLDADAPRAAQRDLGWTLGVILRRLTKGTEGLFHDIPGGPRGYQVIGSACAGLAAHQGEISAQLGIDRTVLTYLIDDLESAGLVSRQPDPSDRRRRRLVVTDAGRALWADRRAALARIEDEILGVLGDDRTAFTQMLGQVAESANHITPLINACEIADQLHQPNC